LAKTVVVVDQGSEASVAQAVASASTATKKAEIATTKAEEAASSEANAATSESNAATSETNAKTSETNAATSEVNAKTSEENATTSATNAATIEVNAKTSETNAARSESNAAASETNAGSSATAAAKSETNAATSEANASTYADNAAASADEAEKLALQDYTGTMKLLDAKIKEGPHIDVRAFGAVGDGSSHPLSSYYSTLAAAQAVYSFATALTNEIDWCGIQAALNYANSSTTQRGHIKIPPGDYIMSAAVTIPPQTKQIYIQANGVTLTSNGFSGNLITWTNSTSVKYPQYLTIDGITLDGDYVSNGISISEANIWLLHNVTILNCYCGLKLADTYYGQVSGESCIRNCYRGVQFSPGTSAFEINTIKFKNVKLDFTSSISKFVAQGSSETDTNYALRCTSQAFRIESMLNAIVFDGCIIEGFKYGFLGFYTSDFTATGSDTSIFTIRNCYFENIGTQGIALAGISVDSSTSIESLVSSDKVSLRIAPKVRLEGNRFYGTTAGQCTLGCGSYEILGNETSMNLYLLTGAYRTTIKTDIPLSSITTSGTLSEYQSIQINSDYSYVDINNKQYGVSSVDPTVDYNSTLRTFEDNNAHIGNYKLSDIKSMTTRPITFESFDKEVNGPVIKSPSGYYYMLTVDDSGSITSKKVSNLSLLKRRPADYYPEELYKLRNSTTTSTSYNCLQMIAGYYTNTLTLDSSGQWLLTTGYPYFGTAAYLSTLTIPSGTLVYDLQTRSVFNGTGTAGKYYWYSDVFGVYDSTRTIISMGTYANMPTASSTYNGNIYYAYDTNAFYKCVSGAWASYTPAFTTPSVSSITTSSTAITVTFNKAITSASCSSSTITLTDTTTSTAITCTYSVSSNVLIITPASTLTSGDSFSLAITGDVYDTTYELNKMGRPYSTTFTIS